MAEDLIWNFRLPEDWQTRFTNVNRPAWFRTEGYDLRAKRGVFPIDDAICWNYMTGKQQAMLASSGVIDRRPDGVGYGGGPCTQRAAVALYVGNSYGPRFYCRSCAEQERSLRLARGEAVPPAVENWQKFRDAGGRDPRGKFLWNEVVAVFEPWKDDSIWGMKAV